jgi:chromosome segregation ATPase
MHIYTTEIFMTEKSNKQNIKEEARNLRKQKKRLEESRSSIKTKNREKGKIIKAYQDRQNELEQNRNEWKAKYKQKENEHIEIEEKYKYVAGLFEMKEEELKNILKEFEELKKKYPQKR